MVLIILIRHYFSLDQSSQSLFIITISCYLSLIFVICYSAQLFTGSTGNVEFKLGKSKRKLEKRLLLN